MAVRKVCFSIITVFSLRFFKVIFNHFSFIGAVCARLLYCLCHDCCCFQPVSVLVIQVLCSDCCHAAWPRSSKLEYEFKGLSIQAFLWLLILSIRCLKTPISKISSAHLVVVEILVKCCKEKCTKFKSDLKKKQKITRFVNLGTWLANH